MIYLDYQATTPLAPEVRAAMLPWLDGPDGDGFANPAANYRAGRAAAVAVERARDAVAALLPPGGRVIFTSGATEAINWALFRGTMVAPGGLAVSAIEHAATIQCAEALGGAIIPVSADGIVVAADGAPLPDNGVVALMLVNNEIGTIQPIADYAAAAHARGSLLLCDAVQGFGRMAIPEGPDLIAVTAHKLHGPKGIGALWIRDGLSLPPLLLGGGQEMGLRSGTVAPALAVGFGEAARLAAERITIDAAHVADLWRVAREELAGWTINGAVDPRYRGNINIRRDGINATRILSDLRNIAMSLGSACGSGSGRTSHVLRALGLSDAQARSSIRLGWGRYTMAADLRAALRAITAAADQQQIG